MTMMASDELGADLTEEQILNGWGNLGPAVVRMRRRIDALEARLPAAIPVEIGHVPQGIVLPDYLLAPAPDYRSELPAEADPCSCCGEVSELRRRLDAANKLLERCAITLEPDRSLTHDIRAHLRVLIRETSTNLTGSSG